MMSPSTLADSCSATVTAPKGPPATPAPPAADLDSSRTDPARARAARADGHLLAVDIAAHMAVHLQLVLGDDRDVLPEECEIVADHRGTDGGWGIGRGAF